MTKIPKVPVAKAEAIGKIPAAFAKGMATKATNYGPAIPNLPAKKKSK